MAEKRKQTGKIFSIIYIVECEASLIIQETNRFR